MLMKSRSKSSSKRGVSQCSCGSRSIVAVREKRGERSESMFM